MTSNASGTERELQFLRLAANQMDRAIAIVGADGRVNYINSIFTTMFGYDLEEVIGVPGVEFLADGESDAARGERITGQLRLGIPFQDEILMVTRSGKPIWVSALMNPLFDAAGQYAGANIGFSNITESRQIHGLQRAVLEAMAYDHPLAQVMDILCRKVEELCPEVICTVLSVEDGRMRAQAAPSLPTHYCEAVDGIEVGPMQGSCGTAAYTGEEQLVTDIDTDPRWARFKTLALPLGLRACWSSPIKLRNGHVAGTFALYFRENRGPSRRHEHIVNACLHLAVIAMERNEAKAHIAKLAYSDMLTGLPNRMTFKQRLAEIIAAADAETHLAILFVDIDRFKDVNDTLGHQVGDDLLVAIADRLQRQLRADDMVARLGGDEFVVLLHDCDAGRATGIARRLLVALADPVSVETHLLPVSASLGISLFPEHGADGDSLLKNADTAMYQAKNAGRGTFRFFAEPVQNLAQERLMLGAALRESISRGLMRLAYQPQIRVDTGRLYGAEALARWSHPLSGDVAPSRFIALAEECGLIEAIDDWALDEACRQLAGWDRAGLAVPTVSVNLSPVHFRNGELAENVRQVLQRHGLTPERLTLEITESLMMDQTPTVMENVFALRQHGVGLSMDDFGTGYSSLGYLSKLPVTEVKIDRSFVAALESDKGQQAVVTAVVKIGQSLDIAVVAEGVEAESQQRFLSDLGCTALQGFRFSRALPPADFESWARSYFDERTAGVA